MKRTALINARLLDPETNLDIVGDLVIENGVIADFGPNLFKDAPPTNGVIINCDSKCLAPGFFDIRVQVREPGEEHKESIKSACMAAAAGGITSIVCLPNTDPVIDNVSVVEYLARRAREEKKVKIFCYGSITRGMNGKEITEMGLLSETDGVLAFTDGEKAVQNPLVLRRALSYARTFGLLIVQHPEEFDLVEDGVMTEGEIASRLGLAGIPAIAEVMMIERDLRIVALTGGRYHAAHISTADAVEAIRKAKRDGLDVTCDTAPHYFALNENAIGDYRTFAKVSPPLRRERDRQAIVNGLADGTIDAIASDHAPHDEDSKRLPFNQAAFGIVGMETLFPLTLELYHNGHLSLLDALRKITINPAKLLGQPFGRLAKGAPGDLVLFDPDVPGKIDVDAFHSKSKNSPFEDRPIQGRILRTIVEGRTIYAAEP